MALEDEELNLSSIAEIEEYLRSATTAYDGPMEVWAVLRCEELLRDGRSKRERGRREDWLLR